MSLFRSKQRQYADEAMEKAARPRHEYAMPVDTAEENAPYVDDVIAAIQGTVTQKGGADK